MKHLPAPQPSAAIPRLPVPTVSPASSREGERPAVSGSASDGRWIRTQLATGPGGPTCVRPATPGQEHGQEHETLAARDL